MLRATTLAARLLRHSLVSCRTCCKAEDFASPASKSLPLWHHCHVGFHPQLALLLHETHTSTFLLSPGNGFMSSLCPLCPRVTQTRGGKLLLESTCGE